MFNLESLDLMILPAKPRASFKALSLHDQAYNHFKLAWERTLTLRAGPGSFDAYVFFRQDAVICLMYEGKIAAQALSSLLHLDLSLTNDLSYFENFKGAPFDTLKSRGAKAVSTIEYSSVARDFSPRKIGGACLNEIINRLGSKLGFHLGADAIIGLPRRITGTNDKALKLGFRRIVENRARYGLSVDVMVGFENEITQSDDLAINQAVERLWANRTNLVSSVHQSEPRIPIQRQEISI